MSCSTASQQARPTRQSSSPWLAEPFRWSEDFGYFTSDYTGAFFGLGSGTGQPQLHDDGYDYPDALIAIGARLYREIIDAHLG